MSLFKLTCIILAGVAIRWILYDQGYSEPLGNSYEVITPLTSFKRLLEGQWLSKQGKSPYSGSSYHGVPLLIPLTQYFLDLGLENRVLFIAFDVVSAIALFFIPIAYKKHHYSKEQQVDQKEENNVVSKNKDKNSAAFEQNQKTDFSAINQSPSINLPIMMALLFMFNPFSIMSCVGQSIQGFQNAIIFCAVLFLLQGSVLLSSILLAICIYMSPYYLVLIAPSVKLIGNTRKRAFEALFVIFTFVFIALLLVASFIQTGGNIDDLVNLNIDKIIESRSWAFLDHVYGFQFFVQDLQPNIGIFWYFFTELFQHFRLLFLFVFQYHVFIYSIPVTHKLRRHPTVAFWVLLSIVCCFKSYPSVSDIVLCLSSLPLNYHLLSQMSYTFVIGAGIVISSVMLPIMWRMWIWTGTGNANFYYALNLVSTLTYGILITDVIASVIKRDFLLKRK